MFFLSSSGPVFFHTMRVRARAMHSNQEQRSATFKYVACRLHPAQTQVHDPLQLDKHPQLAAGGQSFLRPDKIEL